MRRKPGHLLSVELAILRTAVGLRANGVQEFHGFMIAKEMVDGQHSRRLTGHGTLYKALDRLRQMGWWTVGRTRWLPLRTDDLGGDCTTSPWPVNRRSSMPTHRAPGICLTPNVGWRVREQGYSETAALVGEAVYVRAVFR